NDARQEQGADGHVAEGAVDDHGNAGGDDAADGRGGRGHRDGKSPVVARPHHGGDDDGADAGGVGGRRPRNARKQHAHQHVDVGQSSPYVAHQRVGQLQQPGGDLTPVHDPPGQQEEGDGQQGEAVHALIDVVDDYVGVQFEGYRRQQRGQPHGHRDGDAQNDEDEETAHQQN